jgi:hypothetical protein
VSDRLRGVRSGYLLDGGTPVTGNYVDAVSDQLRAGFGPPPTPSVGYAATAEYVYPSQKMVTGAALAGAMLRGALAGPSYSSPANAYHAGLRGLRGLHGVGDKFTITAGMNATQAIAAAKTACGTEVSLADLLRMTGASSDRNIKAGTYTCDIGGAGAGAAGDTGSLPDDIAQVLLSLQREGKIDGDDVTDYADRIIRGEAAALTAYDKATTQQKNAYKSCVREEASKAAFLPTNFANCRDLVGLAAEPGILDWLAEAAAAAGAVTAEGAKLAIDAGIQKLQSAGKPVPTACSPSKYNAGCAGAVLAAVSALDRETGGNSNDRLPGYTPPGSESDNTGLFIGLGVAAIAVIGILAVVMSKKQSASAA